MSESDALRELLLQMAPTVDDSGVWELVRERASCQRRSVRRSVLPGDDSEVWEVLPRRASRQRRSVRRYVLPIAVAVVLLAATVFGLLELASVLQKQQPIIVFGDPTSLSDIPSVQEAQISQRLKDAGVEVSAVHIQDDTMRITYAISPTNEANRLENVLKYDLIVRLAAEAGMTSLEEDRVVDGKVVSSPPKPVRYHPATHLPPAEAEEALVAWVKQVESATGVDATWNIRGNEWRLDVSLVGAAEGLRQASEQLLGGGSLLHDQGALDLITVVARNEKGVTMFEGAGDFVVGSTYRVYAAPEFSVD